ncbi:MAG: hypothetical protein J6B80_05665 [Clostridia bacterium]|nr:hypothetical protein [Clostridia bacterium]
MKKITFYTEVAYIVGLVMLAFGTALMTWGGFGMSMVVAPAYILHLKLSQILPAFTFGMAEYLLQGVIIAVMMLILKRVRLKYVLTFLTTVIYGLLLDLSMSVLPKIVSNEYIIRVAVYVGGILLCTAAIAFLFKTYFPPAAYEVFVKNISNRFNIKLFTFKTVFDCSFCAIAFTMSLLLLGRLEGIGIGTVICALIYGTLIGLFTKLFDKIWVFKDKFNLKIFKESEGK